MSAQMDRLKKTLKDFFAEKSSTSKIMEAFEPGKPLDRRLFAIYLIETFHYTRHNARNQAAVAINHVDLDIRYMKYCLKHAHEEAGHEMMAFHDLKSLGYKGTVEKLPEPLPQTQTLIGYLYHVSKTGNPLARLGYSFWAERSYQYIEPMLGAIRDEFGIKKGGMTFFDEHSDIDTKHAAEVEEVIERTCKTDEDWKAIEDCMIMSLKLTGLMMKTVYEEFLLLQQGKSDRYAFLNESIQK
ncbi:MAG: iron-containing redox enzyme family protein [Bdellovibrionales bacterium]|nr:iron-containing redox enzyme family protein [Bdellovibrionales bacterium]